MNFCVCEKKEKERERVRERGGEIEREGEINSIEQSTTKLDLAGNRQRRRKTRKHNNRWNEKGSNLHLDAAPIALPRQDQDLQSLASLDP